MDENKKQYLSLSSEIIARVALILGPDIAILKARSVKGLQVRRDGVVSDINGDIFSVFQNLVRVYAELFGQATKIAMEPIFAKYPQIKNLITLKSIS
ncbi:MAG: hypothetical protein ABIJ84_02130 [bacterium]